MPYSFFELDRAVVHAEAWPRGATPHLRSWAADKRSYPTSEVRGSGQECQAVMAQEWLRGATPHPRPGTAAERSNPTSKEWWLCGHRRAKRSYSTFKVRRGGSEEILLVQGKRNPNKMVGVARGHRRADTLKP